MSSEHRRTDMKKCVLLVALAAVAPIAAADWTQFRGSDRSGVSKESGLPLEWSATKYIVWKTELPGPGSLSPIVFSGRVYVTRYSGYGSERVTLGKEINLKPGDLADLRRHLVCIDAKTGKVLWTRAEADP